MDQIYSWLHSTFEDISNDTSHAKIRVKMKKLWLQQVGEEKQATEYKLCYDIYRLCCDKARKFVVTNPHYVVTFLDHIYSFFIFFRKKKERKGREEVRENL